MRFMSPVQVKKKAVILLSVIACVAPLSAQVIELGGGTSTLFQSQGGEVTVRGKGYSAATGGGMINGKFYGGAQFVKAFESASLTAGTDNVTFDLPTDIFQGGHYLTVVGLGLRKKISNADVYGFIGETSTSFNSPFFTGTSAEKPAVILFASGKVSPQWTAATRVIIPNSFRATIIHSMAYDAGDGVQFALSGGLGTGQLYFASSLSIERKKYDLKAAYIESSSQFRRANIAVPLTAEPDRDNVLFTYRPTSWASFTAGRQNYLTPIYQSSNTIRSTVNQGSASIQVLGSGLTASIFQSKYGGGENIATAYSASRSIRSRIYAQASYLVSNPENSPKTASVVGNVQENLTPRWSISQMFNTTNGQKAFGCGASFLSNLATLSANYQTFYVPARINAPFEEALIVNAQINILGRLSLNGGTFVAPDGSLLYTAGGKGTISREVATRGAVGMRSAIGDMVIRGRVVDIDGQPIMGAALLVDQLSVYTDSQGYFYVHERKPRLHPFTVLIDQFLDGSLYKVVSSPNEVRSSSNSQTETLVVVQRVIVARS